MRWVKRKKEQVPALAIFVQGSLWVWSATSRGRPPDGGLALAVFHRPCTLNAVRGAPVVRRGDARVAPPCPTTSCVWRSLPYLTLPSIWSLGSLLLLISSYILLLISAKSCSLPRLALRVCSASPSSALLELIAFLLCVSFCDLILIGFVRTSRPVLTTAYSVVLGFTPHTHMVSRGRAGSHRAVSLTQAAVRTQRKQAHDQPRARVTSCVLRSISCVVVIC